MIGKKRFISFNKIVLSTALFCLILSGQVVAGVGEAAVITLIFPPGARSTGFAETFTGLADDATATYYNPAGLGQSPLANSWKSYFHNDEQKFTAIASKSKKAFASKSKIWAGTKTGLMRFNGKAWETYESYLVEEGDDLDRIVSKFINLDDKDLKENALWQIKVENEIGMQHFSLIKSSITDALKNNDTKKPDSIAELYARRISNLASFERSVGKIFTIISGIVKDSTQADKLANTLDSHFSTPDDDFKDKHEIKVPFSIAISETVTSLAIDETERLWVGTENGLWRYNESEWALYTMLDGLPSNKITAIAAGSYGELAVGTDKGIALYNSGQWTNYDTSNGIPESYITSIAFGSGKEIYAGTESGLVKMIDSSVTLFDTSDGLLSSNITSLFFDSQKRLWIGSENGVTINNSTSWKRYKFPNTTVTSFAEQKNGDMWLGTNNGAISYREKKERKDKQGNMEQRAPTWKVFHSKNALTDDHITAMTTENNDVWIATETAINRYDYAEKQAMITFEPLLPAFGINDLWHLYGAFVLPTSDWGTIGLSVNYIAMGENELYDALGRERGKVRSWEGVFGLSYGLPVKDDFSLGINAKYVISALAPGYNDKGDGVGQTFAIDAAILKRNLFFKNFDLGFMMQNMGPAIFYIDRTSLDPIPFTLRLGLAYRAVETPIHDLTFLFDMHKEVVKNYFGDKDPDNFLQALKTDLFADKDEDFLYEIQEINYNLGLEYWYSQFLALRSGFLIDYIGERYEWTFGIGIKWESLCFDWSYIYSPEGFMKGILKSINDEKTGATGARHGQWRTSFLINF